MEKMLLSFEHVKSDLKVTICISIVIIIVCYKCYNAYTVKIILMEFKVYSYLSDFLDIKKEKN